MPGSLEFKLSVNFNITLRSVHSQPDNSVRSIPFEGMKQFHSDFTEGKAS